MGAITIVHDCDAERRATPNALNGDFRDCYLNEEAASGFQRNYDSSSVMMGVVVPGGKGTEYEYRALFCYDLRAFIPAGATPTAASWHIYVATTTATATQPFRIVRIRRHDWEEDQATWEAYRLYDSGTATGGTTTTIEDTGASWPDLTGYKVKVYYPGEPGWDYTTVTSNTPTVLTVSPAIRDVDAGDLYLIRTPWAAVGAGDTTYDRDPVTPGAVVIGTLDTTGWKAITGASPYIFGFVEDAWNDRDGICTFICERYDNMTVAGAAIAQAKPPPPTDPYATTHHLRITYTLDGRTFQALVH